MSAVDSTFAPLLPLKSEPALPKKPLLFPPVTGKAFPASCVVAALVPAATEFSANAAVNFFTGEIAAAAPFAINPNASPATGIATATTPAVEITVLVLSFKPLNQSAAF